jgi:hypothetical protein
LFSIASEVASGSLLVSSVPFVAVVPVYHCAAAALAVPTDAISAIAANKASKALRPDAGFGIIE